MNKAISVVQEWIEETLKEINKIRGVKNVKIGDKIENESVVIEYDYAPIKAIDFINISIDLNNQKSKCDCGGEKCKLPCLYWCSTKRK